MKKSKIALITTGCLVTAPVVTLATGIISSCSTKVAPDDDGISVSTKDVEVDHNNGVGTFDVILDEQPVDNVAYVYVITAEGPHHVELLDPDPVVYHGHPAVLYGVENGIAHVNIGFTEFVGETTKTVVGIEVRYNNRKGQWVLKHVNGINLTVTYVHNPREDVHIFALNDLHGVAEGYGEEGYPTTSYKDPGLVRIAQRICPVIDSHPGSFLVTAGDNNSGDVFSTAVHGSSIYHMLQTIGARYSAVGNHAFEWGITPMATYQFDNWARTPDTVRNYFLASNILNGKLDDKKTWESDPDKDDFDDDFAFWNSQRVGWADPYKIVNMNGHLVCLIGLTTSATLSDGNKSVVDNLSFIDYQNYTAAVNYSMYLCEHEVDPSLFNNIESIVLLTHVESGAKHEDGSEPTGAAADLAANVKFEKVDAVISGHSHKLVNGTVRNRINYKPIFVGQAESEGRKVLDLTFSFDNTKPVGQKKIGVTQNIIDFQMAERYDPKTHPGEDLWKKAQLELDDIKNNPLSPTVEKVNSVFGIESENISRTLDNTILASRSDSLLYPATRKDIGHEYYINQRDANGGIPDDGGYIIDQLGAWVARGMITGFTQLFQEEIAKSTKGLTYPSIGLINQDSMKIEYTDDPSTSVDVTLRDMYNIQTYENTTKFGYLSIWQLANIINHSLAGQDIFNYEKPEHNYYVPEAQSADQPEPKTPDNSLSNLSHYYMAECYNEFCPEAAPENKFDDHGPAKGEKLQHTWCLYNCGPIQMYGVRFKVVRATTDSNPDEAGRIWRLANIKNTNKYEDLVDIPYFPDIYILDPLAEDEPETKEPENLYSTMQDPTKWISAEEWCYKYGTMIPVVTNNFLYDGANWETPMAKVYMDYNWDMDSKGNPVMNFSQITRELLIAACEASTKYSDKFPFDMPKSILEKLVVYPS